MDIIELRSDTRTVPTQEMRDSFFKAEFGDWTYGQSDSVAQLQMYAAKLFGKQDAAYVVSGVFGNQVSILTAGNPGQQLIVKDKSHIIKYENGSIGKLARMMAKTVDCPEGHITLDILKKAIRKKKDNQSPKTTILALEFPSYQGLVQPFEQFNQCAQYARSQGMHVHVDGARVFSGLIQAKLQPSQFAKNVSSLTFCLSKGLCGPLGSIVVGDKDFIAKLKINRKMLGGVIRQPGIVVGAGLIALTKMRQPIKKDHEIALLLSTKLVELGWFKISIRVETTMIFFEITDKNVDVPSLVKFLEANKVFIQLSSNGISRVIVHHYIRQPQVQKFISLLKQFREKSINS